MLVDRNEIESLLTETRELPDGAVCAQQAIQTAPPRHGAPADPELSRILHLRVPVIVRLACRTMPVRVIRRLAPGSIIEFEKSVEEELDLLINNHPVAHGLCVKVGEHFGIRVTRIKAAAQRIQSLGA